MTGVDPSTPREEPRTDGGAEDDHDSDDESRGGWLSWLWTSRDERIRSLRRERDRAERKVETLTGDVEDLRGQVATLKEEKKELEAVKRAYEQRAFTVPALLESVGTSFREANRELARQNVAVGDLDVVLRADVSGGSKEDSLTLRLVDPDEGIDADRLSTFSFSVGGRGRFRQYRHAGTGRADDRGTFVTAGAASDEEAEDKAPQKEVEARGEEVPPVEVPDVTGLSVEDAEEELDDEGFGVRRTYQPEATPAGQVVEQWPRGTAVVPSGSTVVLFVAGTEKD